MSEHRYRAPYPEHTIRQFFGMVDNGSQIAVAARQCGIHVPSAYTLIQNRSRGGRRETFKSLSDERDRLLAAYDEQAENLRAWKRYATALEGGHGAEEINEARKAVGR